MRPNSRSSRFESPALALRRANPQSAPTRRPGLGTLGAKAVAFLELLALLVCLNVHAADLGADRTLILRATITVRNDGDRALDTYIHRLTIPADNHPQQRLLRIDYSHGDQYALRSHENGVDGYLRFRWSIPPRSTLTRDIRFHLRLTPYDFRGQLPKKQDETAERFLAPSHFVESDAPEVRQIAREIERTHIDPVERAEAAFRYPQGKLKYRRIENRGALFALRNAEGDCTEYAAVFVAVVRAMGIPARMTAEFHLAGSTVFAEPNHHAAEAYLNGAWWPVDPNLALDPRLGYGFGHGKAAKIVLSRGDSWTWSNSAPASPKGYLGKAVTITHRWSVEE